MKDNPFSIKEPSVREAPIILSIPHCGTEFPEDIKNTYSTEALNTLDDTDWYLDKLYDFASSLGITTIRAKYSRWVIDLNRTPESKPLYNDGRIITKLCPTTDFFGNNIYKEIKFHPDNTEINRRLNEYFYPYHNKVDAIISDLKSRHKKVIFFDAHSIRRTVETINKNPFPDFILGDNDNKTADKKIINSTLNSLRNSEYKITHNNPFRGGYLTRSKGDIENNIHALQLEMSKDLYMSNNETIYDYKKSKKIKLLLQSIFKNIIAFSL
jgi:N-formylglutamate deformylase